MLAAAPTTPPCFRHWRRSSSLLAMFSGKSIFICSSETPAGVSELLFHGLGSWETNSPSHRCAMPAPSGMGPLCPCKEAPSWKELAANAVSRLRKSAFFIFFAAFLFFPLDKPPIFRYNKARSGGKRRTNLSDHGPVAQLVRAPACHAGGRRFEPDPGRHLLL